jgi:hypothetical protein
MENLKGRGQGMVGEVTIWNCFWREFTREPPGILKRIAQKL